MKRVLPGILVLLSSASAALAQQPGDQPFQQKTDGFVAQLDERRDGQSPAPFVDSQELAEQTYEENFVPWPFGERD